MDSGIQGNSSVISGSRGRPGKLPHGANSGKAKEVLALCKPSIAGVAVQAGGAGWARALTVNLIRDTGSSSTEMTNEYGPSCSKRRLLKVNDLMRPKSVVLDAWGGSSGSLIT